MLQITKKRRLREINLPAAVCLLCVDQIIIDDLHCRFPYCVHPLYPKHRIVRCETFRDIFLFGKFIYQPKEHILRLLVQIGKVAVQFTIEEQPGIERLTVFPDIPQLPCLVYQIKVPSKELSDALVDV